MIEMKNLAIALEKDNSLLVNGEAVKLLMNCPYSFQKIPVQIVVGDGEVSETSVNIRRYGQQGNTSMKLLEAIKSFKDELSKFTC